MSETAFTICIDIVEQAIIERMEHPDVRVKIHAGDAAQAIVGELIDVPFKPDKSDTGWVELSFEKRKTWTGDVISKKPINFTLNIKKLLTAVANAALTIPSAIVIPWLAPFAVISILVTFDDALSIKLPERDSAVLFTMWNLGNVIHWDGLLDKVNTQLKMKGRSPISEHELNDSLAELERIKCIKLLEKQPRKWRVTEIINPK